MKNAGTKTFLVLALAAACWLSAGIIHAQDVQLFVGDWEGAVFIGGEEIAIVCHFTLEEGGLLTGTIDSPDQGAFGLALADIEVDGKTISFGISDPNVPGDPIFEGTLDEAGTKISGDFAQGEGEGTFELSKK